MVLAEVEVVPVLTLLVLVVRERGFNVDEDIRAEAASEARRFPAYAAMSFVEASLRALKAGAWLALVFLGEAAAFTLAIDGLRLIPRAVDKLHFFVGVLPLPLPLLESESWGLLGGSDCCWYGLRYWDWDDRRLTSEGRGSSIRLKDALGGG
jgi:hypothetical protein